MAYHGYIPAIKGYLSQIQNPFVLEIGLDKGMTTIPLLAFLARNHENFSFVGVDVLLQDSLSIIVDNIDFKNDQKISLNQDNSLNVIPKLIQSSLKFDLILLDGDHNYYTVSKELSYLDNLTKDNSIVIIDDYHGRWSDKDLWYADREDYKDVPQVTQKIETEKCGVKPAVDEFLSANPCWESFVPIKGEPIVLRRKTTEVPTTT